MVLAVRPADVLGQPELRKLADVLNKDLGLESASGLPLQGIEQVTFVGLRNGRPPVPPGTPIPAFGTPIIRALQPTDWSQLIRSLVPDQVEATYAGEKYYKSAKNPAGMCYFLPDDRTIIVDFEANLRRFISEKANRKPSFPWSDLWRRVEAGQLAAAVDITWLTGASGPLGPLQEQVGATAAAFSPLWEDTRTVVLGFSLTNGLKIEALAACKSEEGGERVAKTTEALLTLVRNLMKQMREQAANAPKEQRAFMLTLAALADELVNRARVDLDGSTVRVSTDSKVNVADLAEALAPAALTARQATLRTEAMNNLKQIGLAMHNYHDVHRSFPPAVLYGPDGKTPYSWRVALLPFLADDDLFKQYNFNEPWDSPANRKVLEQMPGVYANPTGGLQSGHTPYFVLAGKDTVFSGKEGTRVQDIVDGLSNTLMVVEAKQAVPWTKPDDIPYASDKPLARLGGLHPRGFHALLCDGSVRFISDAVDEKLLRALITKAGGEVIGGW